MKEKDLEKNLDNLIIDGLIKEAEQDNADFEAAMRSMSQEDFEEIISDPAYTYLNNASLTCMSTSAFSGTVPDMEPIAAPCGWDDAESEVELAAATADRPVAAQMVQESKWKSKLRPWIAAAVVAAAIILIVLIPKSNALDGKLCDSALYVSSEYISASRSASAVTALSASQLKAKLPGMERRFNACLDEDGVVLKSTRNRYASAPNDPHAFVGDEFKESGWNLVLAYLKLHKKDDAEKVLEILSEQYKGTPFGDHCQVMLDHLR